jgi:hypothetical protein
MTQIAARRAGPSRVSILVLVAALILVVLSATFVTVGISFWSAAEAHTDHWWSNAADGPM